MPFSEYFIFFSSAECYVGGAGKAQTRTLLCFSARLLKGLENERDLSPGSYWLLNGSMTTFPEQTDWVPLFPKVVNPTPKHGIGLREDGRLEKRPTGGGLQRSGFVLSGCVSCRGSRGPFGRQRGRQRVRRGIRSQRVQG